MEIITWMGLTTGKRVMLVFEAECSRCVFFFKQKSAYEMRISDWSSDVCSSDLSTALSFNRFLSATHRQSQALCSVQAIHAQGRHSAATSSNWFTTESTAMLRLMVSSDPSTMAPELTILFAATVRAASHFSTVVVRKATRGRSEEHTAEIQSLMR